MCSICCEKLDLSEDIKSTDCGHIFHQECLDKWLLRSSCCPQCRKYSPRNHRIYLQLSDLQGCASGQRLVDIETEILKLKQDLNECHMEKNDIQETLNEVLNQNSKLECQLETSHMDLLKLKMDLSRCNNLRNELENTLKSTLQGNVKVKLNTTKMTLNLNNNKNENNNIEIDKKGCGKQNQQNEIEIGAISLTKTSNNEKCVWLIKQPNEDNCQVRGPYDTISDGIIALQKETLEETCLIIKGVKKFMANKNWFSYIEGLAKSIGIVTLKNTDIITIKHNYERKVLFVQFRTAEWRNNFLNHYNQNNNHLQHGISFTGKMPRYMLTPYDTLFEYAKTLKVLGYADIYRHSGSSVLVKCFNGQTFVARSKGEVDDIIKAQLEKLQN